MPSLGTGASGLGQQLADLIGGLLGSSDNGTPGSADLDPTDETRVASATPNPPTRQTIPQGTRRGR